MLTIFDDLFYVYFIRHTEEFGRSNDICILYSNDIHNSNMVLDYVKAFAKNHPFSYGIRYIGCRDMYDAVHYAGGNGYTTIYPYEKYSFCYDKSQLKENKILRMVYSFNIINNHHLNIAVGNMTLKTWILSDKKHGELEKLNSKMWIWQVADSELEHVNNYLGQLGLLISWQAELPEGPKPKRRLP